VQTYGWLLLNQLVRATHPFGFKLLICPQDATAAYTPVNVIQQLQAINAQLQAMNTRLVAMDNRLTGVDDRLTGVDDRLAIITATTDNIRIIGYNSRQISARPLRPLKKTVSSIYL
jgi:hypothetical protein